MINTSEDESRIITVDNMGVEREYDINFDYSRKPFVLLYRMIDNERSTMLCSEDIKSTPSSVIKRLLEKGLYRLNNRLNMQYEK